MTQPQAHAHLCAQKAHHDHFVRRLEAFSDLVIAFGLSQLAFNLPIPANAGALHHHVSLVGFLGNFGLICGIWWLHNRLFARYFIPDTISVLLNFVLLAGTIYSVYSSQLLGRFGAEPVVLSTYSISIALVYGLLGILYLKGTREAILELTASEKLRGTWLGIRLVIFAAVFAISVAAISSGLPAVAKVWLIGLALVITLRVVERRIARGQKPLN